MSWRAPSCKRHAEGRYRVWESDTANYGEAQALTLLEAFRAEQVVYVQQRVTAIRAKGRASAAAYRAAYPEIQRFREHRAHLVAQARDPQGWAEKRRGENARYYLRAKARREHPESADLI